MIREITLPAEAVDVLRGSYGAGRMFQDMNAAFWLHGRDDSAALHLLREVHENFARIADALGYTIAPKEAPVAEAAE